MILSSSLLNNVSSSFSQKVHSPSPPPSLPLSDAVVRLFVKNVSADHNPASLKTVFSRYGEVIKMLPDPKRRNVTYVVSSFVCVCVCVCVKIYSVCVYSIWMQKEVQKLPIIFTGRPFLKTENHSL